jgi:hypothetical protein
MTSENVQSSSGTTSGLKTGCSLKLNIRPINFVSQTNIYFFRTLLVTGVAIDNDFLLIIVTYFNNTFVQRPIIHHVISRLKKIKLPSYDKKSVIS